MTDPRMPGQPGQPGEADQPSPEELQAYLMQLRQADPAEFLMQAFNMLVTGAQAKIGLDDGRMLIDSASSVIEGVADRLPEDLLEAVRNAVSQLKVAQVQAEQQLAEAGPDAAGPEEAGGGEAGQSGAPRVSEPQRKMTDRLWTPGQGVPPVR